MSSVTLPVPRRMQNLPRDKHGRPVPWFAPWINDDGTECPAGTGAPDFRLMTSERIAEAVLEGRCWLCGQPAGAFKAFVVGPMCVVNRISSEPPSHTDCAMYAVQACPFLTTPSMRRRETGLPEGRADAPGIMLKRNPGTVVVYVTKRYDPFHTPDGRGVLLKLGKPVEVSWWREGRPATREEAHTALNDGLPVLRGIAEKDGPAAGRELDGLYRDALDLLPT